MGDDFLSTVKSNLDEIRTQMLQSNKEDLHQNTVDHLSATNPVGRRMKICFHELVTAINPKWQKKDGETQIDFKIRLLRAIKSDGVKGKQLRECVLAMYKGSKMWSIRY